MQKTHTQDPSTWQLVAGQIVTCDNLSHPMGWGVVDQIKTGGEKYTPATHT